jgi:hypothetical protein
MRETAIEDAHIMTVHAASITAIDDRGCNCVGADVAAVRKKVGLPADATYDSMFAELPVQISREDVDCMQAVIDAVDLVGELPAWRDAALEAAQSIARQPQSPRGVFLGYDFHIGSHGPQLIEINTNAGGAMLSAAVRSAQLECCPEVNEYLRGAPDAEAIGQKILEMFEQEWRLARADTLLRSIAIVDDDPEAQYLYPEFRMFERLFAGRGIRTVVADARTLTFEDGTLKAGGLAVDLVYNRCTDFYLESPTHAALAQAYLSGAAVITPHPRAHALYASKRNLALLTDRAFLTRAGATSADVEILQRHVPATRILQGEGESWWADRKRWFFKPMDGFGSRGSYRGDKLTRRVFSELLRGRYVAQEFSPPGERRRRVGEITETFKVDIRNYVYAGEVQQRIARLYQGQTTNFRTVGGGFAPVFVA